MSYTVKLLPSGHVFQAKGSQTIVEAAIDAGVDLPYGCRNGACGACKGRVVEGKVKHSSAPMDTGTFPAPLTRCVPIFAL